MTDSSATAAEPVLDHALRAADAAARAAGVSVRELSGLAELTDLVGLFGAIWGRSANPPVTIDLLRAFAKAGNYVVGAFDGDRLVGACVGFFHAPAGGALHSHIAGVSPAAAGRGVGFALKLHQRAWALLRGVSEIAWTFDPLAARNAYFNLVKLAARPVEYLPDFYGPMLDALNGDDYSDRLLVRWRLRDGDGGLAGPASGVGGIAETELRAGAVVALGIAEDGGPVPGGLDGATSLVAVPPDIAALRAAEPELARRWRLAVRAALIDLTGRGGRIDGFDRTGWYVVRRES
ncbi:GNAT family N-acetyltransferase [Actinomadura chibensis]|uniref:GNAT family N-acetyltransferase n=1 Tax=Actinomadura chibensis TaxID=392828 RepID=A0A5D0NUE2_9ACTN|nr:GNAT family N-acetyltransferase [Actinomadura chibensis]TYB48253.1 GNAT family N-acetyltransferase [Actinomadura chibensis]